MLSRRRFLGTLALGAATMGGGTRLTATGRPEPCLRDDDILFRFLQLNDLHVQQAEGFTHPTYKDANRRVRWVLENLSNPVVFPPLDFVILNGDMIHQGTLESNRDAFAFLRTLLPQISVPSYPVVGNHEVSQHEGDPRWEEPYVQTFGDDRRFYSFEHGGLAFVVFNNSGTGEGLDESVYRERHEQLRRMLAAHAGTPTLVVCHIPVYPVREEAVLARSFGFHSWKTREPAVARILEEHPSVLGVLSGHLHLTGVSHHNPVPQVVFAGTASFPHDMGLFTVSRTAITVEALRLPSNLLVPETNIHGAQRHGVDFTDTEHPSYTSYLMGNGDERAVVISRAAD